MANEPKKVRQRRSMLQIPGVQTILSSLLCIVLGLLVGFVVLLLIDHGVSEKTGNLNAIDAILVIVLLGVADLPLNILLFLLAKRVSVAASTESEKGDSESDAVFHS